MLRIRLALLLHFLTAPFVVAASPRITFERVLPATHDLGRSKDIALVHALQTKAPIETFIEYFLEKAESELRIRDAQGRTGPADVYLMIEALSCSTRPGEGEGSVRDYEGNRVRRRQVWVDAICTVRIDAKSADMRWLTTFYGKGQGTSPRVERITEEETRIALQQAARYAAVDAAERVLPRRIKESIHLDETAPALDEVLPLIDSGRLTEARGLWERALGRQPRSAALHFNLGALCEALGDRKAAAVHYHAARELSPAEPRYKSEMRLFEKRQ